MQRGRKLLKLSETALIEVVQCKRTEIEKKRAETLGSLDARIASLQLDAAMARNAGAWQAAATAEGVLKKFLNVRADAIQGFADAMNEVSKQEQKSLCSDSGHLRS